MPLPEYGHDQSEAAIQERDDQFVGAHLDALWAAAQVGFAEGGRGALVVDTTERQTKDVSPYIQMAYAAQRTVEAWRDDHLTAKVRAYDPATEFVAVLRRANRMMAYRVHVEDEA